MSEFCSRCDDLVEKVNEIHESICSTPKSIGLAERLRILEGRAQIFIWICSAFAIAIIGVLVKRWL